jgi:hypothetical protein
MNDMARHMRSAKLETPTARLRLPVQSKPQGFVNLAPGIALGYRRCRGAGRWIVRAAKGEGSSWQKAFALADDYEPANGDGVLTFFEAQEHARAIARGQSVPNLERNIAAKALAFLEQNIEPACFLYRHYHPNGDLLYVGVSLHALTRQRKHFSEAAWRLSIYRIVIEPFETREEALEAEQLAIKTEFPKFNSVHNSRRYPLAEMPQLDDGDGTHPRRVRA